MWSGESLDVPNEIQPRSDQLASVCKVQMYNDHVSSLTENSTGLLLLLTRILASVLGTKPLGDSCKPQPV